MDYNYKTARVIDQEIAKRREASELSASALLKDRTEAEKLSIALAEAAAATQARNQYAAAAERVAAALERKAAALERIAAARTIIRGDRKSGEKTEVRPKPPKRALHPGGRELAEPKPDARIVGASTRACRE